MLKQATIVLRPIDMTLLRVYVASGETDALCDRDLLEDEAAYRFAEFGPARHRVQSRQRARPLLGTVYEHVEDCMPMSVILASAPEPLMRTGSPVLVLEVGEDEIPASAQLTGYAASAISA